MLRLCQKYESHNLADNFHFSITRYGTQESTIVPVLVPAQVQVPYGTRLAVHCTRE